MDKTDWDWYKKLKFIHKKGEHKYEKDDDNDDVRNGILSRL